MKRFTALLLLILTALALSACDKAPEVPEKHPIATITMTDGSEMRFQLYPEYAPETVERFITLANNKFYDQQIFYRVVAGVLVQGGDPTAKGTGGSGETLKGEFSANGWKYNPISHRRGTISLARREDYDSGDSQFFIMQGSYTEYDGQYAAFGVIMDQASLETLDHIARQPVDSNYKPLFPQTIQSIRVETFEEEAEEAVDTQTEPEGGTTE